MTSQNVSSDVVTKTGNDQKPLQNTTLKRPANDHKPLQRTSKRPNKPFPNSNYLIFFVNRKHK